MITHEYGYTWDTERETRCECGREGATDCEECGEPVCVSHKSLQASGQMWCHVCDEIRERQELTQLWSELLNRKPNDLLHSAWARLIEASDVTDPNVANAIRVIQSALFDLFTGWKQPKAA